MSKNYMTSAEVMELFLLLDVPRAGRLCGNPPLDTRNPSNRMLSVTRPNLKRHGREAFKRDVSAF